MYIHYGIFGMRSCTVHKIFPLHTKELCDVLYTNAQWLILVEVKILLCLYLSQRIKYLLQSKDKLLFYFLPKIFI